MATLDNSKKYLVHNIYGEAQTLIDTIGSNVAIPAGWSPEAEANRKERAGTTSLGKKVDTASLRGTGRRGGQGIVRAKGGLMTKPTKKNMKRGGLASR